MAFADPEQLEQLATQLDAQAEEVREKYRQFRSRVDGVAWQSDGADDYRSHCYRLVADLEANAQGLNDAADDLRKHAHAVRERLQWMSDMVEMLHDKAEELWDDAEGAFDWGKDKADDAWDKVTGWL
ncbi:WXG100 family type VII secretion target [Nocardioides sp.]|uniref:WXG100 family type VII secretion target n=1 Tax=Nocardioides sp. TaxID=35761 RepID=UPI002726BBDE|nr:hypothetical protein [Nocardioides sp.]MDO9458479.1 hypothetical protein [Nocardioides sp.]